MGDFILNIVFRVLAVIVGGWNIASAITNYNDGDYFVCGLYIMLAVWMACLLNDTFRGDN